MTMKPIFFKTAAEFRRWLHAEFEKNVPWSAITTALGATGTGAHLAALVGTDTRYLDKAGVPLSATT